MGKFRLKLDRKSAVNKGESYFMGLSQRNESLSSNTSAAHINEYNVWQVSHKTQFSLNPAQENAQ